MTQVWSPALGIICTALLLAATAPAQTIGTMTYEGQRLQPSDGGFVAPDGIVDPFGVIFPDGGMRLFAGGRAGTVSFLSTDGLNFGLEAGYRLPFSTMAHAYKLEDGRIRFFYPQGSEGIVSAISSDYGTTIVAESGIRLSASVVGASRLSPLSVVPIAGGYRGYFSNTTNPGVGVTQRNVYSATSTDLLTWTLEDGVRIGTGASITRSADHPTAIVNDDGSVTVFYCNNQIFLPDTSGPENIFYATSTDGLTFDASTEVRFRFTGCDPLVVRQSDGSYRLYWNTFDPALGTRIFSGTFAGILTPKAGWWWNASESGRGFSLERRGNNIFLSSYLYGGDGVAYWYVSSMAGSSSAGPFSGMLDAYDSGQTLTGAFKAARYAGNLGPTSISFSAPNAATLTWPGGTLALSRYTFGSAMAGQPTGYPEAGWWWNPSEPGRGYFLEVQGTTMFVSTYLYHESGAPIWHAAQGPMTSTTLFEGTLQEYGGGQTLTGSYQPPTSATSRGAISIQFGSTTTGTLTLSNGTAVPIQRFTF